MRGHLDPPALTVAHGDLVIAVAGVGGPRLRQSALRAEDVAQDAQKLGGDSVNRLGVGLSVAHVTVLFVNWVVGYVQDKASAAPKDGASPSIPTFQ